MPHASYINNAIQLAICDILCHLNSADIRFLEQTGRNETAAHGHIVIGNMDISPTKNIWKQQESETVTALSYLNTGLAVKNGNSSPSLFIW